jgi:signal peptidase
LALICGGFYIVAMFAGGLFDGLGKSPYSFTPKGIMTNFFFVSTLLIWTEFSRAYLINYWAKKRVFLTLGFVSLLFTFTGLSLHKLITLKFGLELIQYIGEQALPVYAENLMISYLAYLGGPVPALLYHGVLECFHWFSPVLPNLGWMTKTLLGTVIPIVSLILVQQLYLSEARELKKEKENPVGMILTGVTGVLIIWFAVGLFPIYPSVIITGSMEPLIKPGDIVLLKKTDGEKVNINEIIEYRDEKINITHRVIDIKNSEKGKKYQTMGDANGIPDAELVSPEQVRGKVIGVVPKIGYLTLLLRSEKNDVDLQDYGGQEI